MSVPTAARAILGPDAIEHFTVEPSGCFLTWAEREPPSHTGRLDEYAPWTAGEVVRLVVGRGGGTRLDVGDAVRRHENPVRGVVDWPYHSIDMRKQHDCFFNAEDFTLRVHGGMSLADALRCEQAITRFARPMYMRFRELLEDRS